MRTVMAITLVALAAGCGSAPAAGTRPPEAVRPVTHARPVHAVALRVGVSGGRAYARAVWWGGVPACYALAPVRVARHGATILGRPARGVDRASRTACIEMAMRKPCAFRWARLEPGSYLVWWRRPHRTPGVTGLQVALPAALRTALADGDRVALVPVVLVEDVDGHQPDPIRKIIEPITFTAPARRCERRRR
jgi:hypothetical protein